MRTAAYWLMTIGCIGVCGYAMYGYAVQEPGASVHPEMLRVYREHPWGIRLHVFGAVLALLLGPAQFHEGLRRRYPKVHRGIGYVYAIGGVAIGGLAGLYMSQYAFGGLVSHIGFAGIAVVWLITGTAAVRQAVRKNFVSHRRWMIRNFALTFAAVTLRIQLGLFFASGFEFEEFYPVLAWSSWVPNLIFADWFLVATERSRQAGLSDGLT